MQDKIKMLLAQSQIKPEEYYFILKHNTLDIDDLNTLEKEEEKISKLKAIELYRNFDSYKTDEISKMKSLQMIHEFILGDLYLWAGKIRNIDISKNNFTFFRHRMMKNGIEYFDNLLDNNFEEIIIKYTEFNYIHPFYEGNGRAGRIWLDLILYIRFGKVINWSNIDKRQYLDYIIEVANNPNNYANLLTLLENNLIEYSITDNDFIFRTVDSSYSYEGMRNYMSKKLFKQQCYNIMGQS